MIGDDRQSMLHIACKRGVDVSLVRCLIDDVGCDVNVVDGINGRIALFDAVESGNCELVIELIERYQCNVIESRDNHQRNLLLVCCRNYQNNNNNNNDNEIKNVKMISMLIERFGVDVNDRDCDGCNAMYEACCVGSIEIVRYLSSSIQYCDDRNGISIDINNKNNNKNENENEIKIMKVASIFGSPIIAAARNGHIHIVQYLIENIINNNNNNENENENERIIEMIMNNEIDRLSGQSLLQLILLNVSLSNLILHQSFFEKRLKNNQLLSNSFQKL